MQTGSCCIVAQCSVSSHKWRNHTTSWNNDISVVCGCHWNDRQWSQRWRCSRIHFVGTSKTLASQRHSIENREGQSIPTQQRKCVPIKVKAEIVNQTEGKVNAKNMAPLDARKGSLRWKLIRLMTWTESNMKRSGSELLWTLCDDDLTQFYAVHFLGMKGCVALPKGVDL